MKLDGSAEFSGKNGPEFLEIEITIQPEWPVQEELLRATDFTSPEAFGSEAEEPSKTKLRFPVRKKENAEN